MVDRDTNILDKFLKQTKRVRLPDEFDVSKNQLHIVNCKVLSALNQASFSPLFSYTFHTSTRGRSNEDFVEGIVRFLFLWAFKLQKSHDENYL